MSVVLLTVGSFWIGGFPLNTGSLQASTVSLASLTVYILIVSKSKTFEEVSCCSLVALFAFVKVDLWNCLCETNKTACHWS